MTYPEGLKSPSGDVYTAGRRQYSVSERSGLADAGESPAPGRPLQVVHVGPCFTRGGAEQQVIDLMRFLDPNRVRIAKCLVTQESMIDPKVVAEMPVPVEFGREEAVRRASREYDVILFWGMGLDGWLAECPPNLCVYLAHGDTWWTRGRLESSRHVVDHVIAVSHRVERLVCDGYETSVILNGVDTARLGQTRPMREVRSAFGFGDDDFVLLYVGRFSQEKRPERLIEAVARLPRRFKALFLGWGPMKEELLEKANAEIPGRFAFVSADSHLGDYYRAADALCLLSKQEGFALVIVEAMLCGRPVIATPVGSAPEVIRDRVNGMLVDGEPDSVATAARLLHDHPHWARGIAAEGQEYAEQCGHALRMARDYERLLEQLWTRKYGSGDG